MFKRLDKKKICIILGLAAIIIVASLPAFRGGIYTGHDLKFHLGRIQAIAEELRGGQFPVRYESGAWYGHGYVSTSFYGNIFLYIPALLFMAGVPVWKAYNIYVILVNLATVLVGYYSFKGIFKSSVWSIIATTIYTLSGYRLSNLYVRTALGEYTAMIFVPLIVYGVYRIYSGTEDLQNNSSSSKDGLKRSPLSARLSLCMPLIIGVTGIIESHILTTELVAGFIFLFALLNFKRTIAVIRELILSLVSILGINAFFVVPFVDSYSSLKLYINRAMTQTSIRGAGLYLSQIFGPITIGRGSNAEDWSTTNEGFLNIGLLPVLCFIVIVFTLIYVYVKKSDWFPTETAKLKYKWAMTAFGFAILAGWMSSVYFPWHIFAGEGAVDKLMSSVQYPWRYSMFQTLFVIIAGVHCLKLLETRNSDRTSGKIIEFQNIKRISRFAFITLGITAVIAIGTTGVFDYTLSYGNITVSDAEAPEDWADFLYLPVGTELGLLSNTEPIIEADASGDTFTFTLPVLAYNYIHVYDEVGKELDWEIGDNNCIRVESQTKDAQFSTQFIEPNSWRVSEAISVGSIILICVIYFKRTKKRG